MSKQLRQYIERFASTEFELGRHDCLTFAVGWVELCSAAQFYGDVKRRVKYVSRRDIQDNFAHLSDWLNAARDLLGPEALDAPQVGDVAIVAQGERYMLGIVGTQLVYVPSYIGVAAVPVANKLYHWRPQPCRP